MLASIQERHAQATDALLRQDESSKSHQIVEGLSASLTLLRNLLVKRVHEDVETSFGVDSMIAPMTLAEEQREIHHAMIEAEIYMIVVAADEMVRGEYVEDRDWCIDWLTQLRLGDELPEQVAGRFADYADRTLDKRRLLFSDMLVRTLPEANKAPLVIFRLFPKAVRLAVATAFCDQLRASEIRNEQVKILPAIDDCPYCHGRPMENGETCNACGNPLWKLNWLIAAD